MVAIVLTICFKLLLLTLYCMKDLKLLFLFIHLRNLLLVWFNRVVQSKLRGLARCPLVVRGPRLHHSHLNNRFAASVIRYIIDVLLFDLGVVIASLVWLGLPHLFQFLLLSLLHDLFLDPLHILKLLLELILLVLEVLLVLYHVSGCRYADQLPGLVALLRDHWTVFSHLFELHLFLAPRIIFSCLQPFLITTFYFDIFAIVMVLWVPGPGIVPAYDEWLIKIILCVRHHNIRWRSTLPVLINDEFGRFVKLRRLLHQHLLDFRLITPDLQLVDLVHIEIDVLVLHVIVTEQSVLPHLHLHRFHLALHVSELLNGSLI